MVGEHSRTGRAGSTTSATVEVTNARCPSDAPREEQHVHPPGPGEGAILSVMFPRRQLRRRDLTPDGARLLHATRVVCKLWVVIQSFADETTVDLFRERNTRASRRIPRDLWRVVQRKLKLIDAAGRLDDLAVPARNRLERLKGDQAGRQSMRVNEQYRVTFRWGNGHAYEVRVEDYH